MMTDIKNDYLPVRGEFVEQTRDQMETGVRVVPHRPRMIEVGGGKQFGKAAQVREEILASAHENLSQAQRHLVEAIEWLEITGLLNTKMEERHGTLKRLVSDLIEDVEGLRKVYVHSPKV